MVWSIRLVVLNYLLWNSSFEIALGLSLLFMQSKFIAISPVKLIQPAFDIFYSFFYNRWKYRFSRYRSIQLIQSFLHHIFIAAKSTAFILLKCFFSFSQSNYQYKIRSNFFKLAELRLDQEWFLSYAVKVILPCWLQV